MKRKFNLLFGVILFCASIALVLVYFSVLGTPAERRHVRMDNQRIEDLIVIVRFLNSTSAPDAEDQMELAEAISRLSDVHDPDSGQEYEVRVINDTEYEVCMVFGRSYREIQWNADVITDDRLKFEPGKNCFRFSTSETLSSNLTRSWLYR